MLFYIKLFTHKTKQAYYHSNLCQLNYLVNIESCVATAKRIIPLPPSRLSQWWIHFYLEILVPPVGSGDYSQLGFSILRSNNFVTKAVINVQFSK